MYFNWDILYLWCILIGGGDAAVEDAIKWLCALDALIARHWSLMLYIVGIPTLLYYMPFLPIHDPAFIIFSSKLPLDCSNKEQYFDLPKFWQCPGSLHCPQLRNPKMCVLCQSHIQCSIQLLESPCSLVGPLVTEKYRIVYSQCIYDANIIPNVRCDHHQDDDDHHYHLCMMRSS